MAYATKTIRNRIENRAGLAAWYEATRTLYNQVVAFYFDLYQAHPGLLEIGQGQALTLAEKLTHKTKQNPNPIIPPTIPVPAMLRRAAINAARGAYRSFWSNLKGWQKKKAQFESNPRRQGQKYTKRPPVPPRQFNFNVPFYRGMFKEHASRSIMLKLWSGQSWQWVKGRFSKRHNEKRAYWLKGKIQQLGRMG